ncbi:MAG: hypothetical protein IKS32_00065 [Solobacterium sp.]|nr:hypothetical protein [Solobacterium sp.]
MAENTKSRKKRKLKMGTFSMTLLVISSLLYLCSTLFLRSYNNSLSSKKQEIEAKIAELQVKNDAVAVEVNTLNNRERVNSIAADKGLNLVQDNIITITKADGD